MSGHERVVVVGGGVGGLATALAGPDAAFATERRGPRRPTRPTGSSHASWPCSGTGSPTCSTICARPAAPSCPRRSISATRKRGDDDLVVLAMRRTTFEWVLRRAVLAEPGVQVRTGVGVSGLTVGRPPEGASLPGPPQVDGVRLADGTVEPADVVVAATGRRGPIGAWLAEVGVAMDETVHESGLMYLSRWYRLPAGVDLALDPKLGGDLGYVKYLGVPGDGGMPSITLAIRSDDAALRVALSDPDGFEQACRALPGPDQFFTAGPLDPVGGVRPMGGLLNRLRRFVDDEGRPTVVGFHAVGDAHTCTNPLYGRGCSLALVQAVLLADAVAEHPDDAVAGAAAYEAVFVGHDWGAMVVWQLAVIAGSTRLSGESGFGVVAPSVEWAR